VTNGMYPFVRSRQNLKGRNNSYLFYLFTPNVFLLVCGRNSLNEHGQHSDHLPSLAFSPLHIPDEEAMDLAAGLTPPSSPMPSSVLGLTSDVMTTPV
jgi:hypothetical protein